MRVVANRAAETITADVPKRFSSLIIELPVQQTGSGDPSPDNIRPIAQWTDVALYVADTDTAIEPTVTTTLPTPIFGGMVDVARGEVASLYNEKKSSSGWEMVEEGQFRCQVGAFNNGDETSTNVADLYSSHYKTVSNKDAYDATDDLTCGTPTIEGVTYLYVNDLDYTTLEAFTAYIGDVQFVYKSHVPMSDAIEPTIVYLPEGTSYVWAEGAFYTETVTGTPPLSLPNSVGKPLEAWSVELSSYQDLHGYDSPWPAGGGKNLVDVADFSGDTSGSELIAIVPAITLSAGTYTLSWTQTSNITSNTRNTPAYKVGSGSYVYQLASENGNLGSGRKSWMITLSEESTITIAYWTHTISPACDYIDFQLEKGSTATDYAPYSNLCPIYGTNQISFVTGGKNLYNKAQYPFVAYTYFDTVCWTEPILLNKGTYTFSCNSGFGNCFLNVYSTLEDATANRNRLYQGYFASGAKLTYTATSNVYVRYQENNVTASTEAYDLVSSSWQTEFGTTKSEYTPYVPQTSTDITLPTTIYSGSVSDDGADSRDAVIVVDENTSIGKTNAGPYYITVAGYSRANRVTCMCDTFKPMHNVTGAVGVDNMCCCFYLSSDQDRLYIRYDDAPTIEDFKTFLASNPVTIVYELATPTALAVTTPSIPTPTGNATVWATAEDGVVDSMSVTYVRKA